MKFFAQDVFSKCEQIHSVRTESQTMRMETLIFQFKMRDLNVDWQGQKRAPMYCIKHQLKLFNNFTLIFLITRRLSGTSFSVNKISFHWSLINANCKYNISKAWFCCFFLHKLWTYFNQTNIFKQKKIYSQKYLHKCLPHIF